MLRRFVLPCLSLLCLMVAGADWPAFRGPQGDGTTSAQQIPTTWNATENVRWKVALPRPGNGSPIVHGQNVLVTSSEDEEGKKRSLYCFDLKSGEQRWVQTVTAKQKYPTHETNPYAGTTPVTDGRRVVVWHASAGLHCYDMAGKPLWQRDLGEFVHIWGYGTSPILYGKHVILHSGPGAQVWVAAFDLETGETVWKTDEPVEGDGSMSPDKRYTGSWATPVVAKVDGHDQLIVSLPRRLNAYDPATGKIIWSCEGFRHKGGDLAYSSPLVVGDICFVTGGFSGPAFSVRLGGQGDVTSSHRLFHNERQPQSIGTGIAVDGYVYRPNAGPGTIDCLDPKTGKVVWSNRAASGNIWGSMVLAEGNIYATSQAGVTVIFRPDPQEYKEVNRNELGDATNATPAVVDGALVFRGMKSLVCIGQK